MSIFECLGIVYYFMFFLLQDLFIFSVLHVELTVHLVFSTFKEFFVLSLRQLLAMIFGKVHILRHKSLFSSH